MWGWTVSFSELKSNKQCVLSVCTWDSLNVLYLMNWIWYGDETFIDQLLSLSHRSQILEAHSCKPWLTNVLIVSNTLGILPYIRKFSLLKSFRQSPSTTKIKPAKYFLAWVNRVSLFRRVVITTKIKLCENLTSEIFYQWKISGLR